MFVRQVATIGLVLATISTGGCALLGTGMGAVQGAQGSVEGVQDTAKGAKDFAGKEKDMAAGALGKKGGAGGAGGADPDGDGVRSSAKDAKLNDAITDEVGTAKGDLADWRVFSLGGKPNLFTVELHWDEPAAVLNVDIYDAFGANLASASGAATSPARKLLWQIDQPGKYYVKISSAKGGSVYTMMAKWAGGGGPVAAAPGGSEVPNPAGGGGGPPPAAGAPAAAGPAADDPNHPRAKIIQSYRGDDGQLVLYLDKGAAANIKAGMSGVILEGPDGDKPLDGGVFKITKVVDATKSIGKTSITKVGKNNRCYVNLIP